MFEECPLLKLAATAQPFQKFAPASTPTPCSQKQPQLPGACSPRSAVYVKARSVETGGCFGGVEFCCALAPIANIRPALAKSTLRRIELSMIIRLLVTEPC